MPDKTFVPGENETERKARTGLSSVEMTDAESKAAQKTPNRVSLDSLVSRIEKEEYLNPSIIPHMTICVLLIENGFAIVGKSTPADPGNFNEEIGRKFSKEDAIRQMWQLEGYLLCEKLTAPPSEMPMDAPTP